MATGIEKNFVSGKFGFPFLVESVAFPLIGMKMMTLKKVKMVSNIKKA